MSKLADLKNKREIENKIAQLMATGKFVDTGKKYDAAEAVADAKNPDLRLTLKSNGQWVK